MAKFNEWCTATATVVGSHEVRILDGDPTKVDVAIEAIAALVPSHYAAEERIARLLARLKKPEAAKFIEEKLPTTKQIRSGDLGEILATEYMGSQTGYAVPIKRLRWKDHRNMAMRGDDVIGLAQAPTGQLFFLKAESKSRAGLTTAVVSEARAGLDKDGGLPSPHALTFVSDRLTELGNLALADAIDDAQLKHGIPPTTVKHMMFTVSQNAPNAFFQTSLKAYGGPYSQLIVGVRVDGHVAFVEAVYDKVIKNANNS